VDAPCGIAEESEINNRLDTAYDSKAVSGTHLSGPTLGMVTDPDATVTPSLDAQTHGGGSPRATASPDTVTPQPGVLANPLADLQVGAVEIKGRDGGGCVVRGIRNEVTVTIRNSGDKPTGEFAVEVKVGNDRRGRKTVSGLATGAETKVVLQSVAFEQGEHTLQVVVDPDHGVAEDDEGNNSKSVEVDCSRS
jgi:hypothetical protein